MSQDESNLKASGIIYPCRNVGQGQLKIIILTNWVGSISPMLHTRVLVIGLLVLEGFLNINAHCDRLGHVTRTI